MTINQEYTLNFWQNSLTTNIYSKGFPLIMNTLRTVGRLVAGADRKSIRYCYLIDFALIWFTWYPFPNP